MDGERLQIFIYARYVCRLSGERATPTVTRAGAFVYNGHLREHVRLTPNADRLIVYTCEHCKVMIHYTTLHSVFYMVSW